MPPEQFDVLQKVFAQNQEILERLDRIEQAQAISVEKEAYTIPEAAQRLGLRPWTLRQHCNKGNVPGAKKVHGKGRTGEWRIPREVLARLQKEGVGRPNLA